MKPPQLEEKAETASESAACSPHRLAGHASSYGLSRLRRKGRLPPGPDSRLRVRGSVASSLFSAQSIAAAAVQGEQARANGPPSQAMAQTARDAFALQPLLARDAEGDRFRDHDSYPGDDDAEGTGVWDTGYAVSSGGKWATGPRAWSSRIALRHLLVLLAAGVAAILLSRALPRHASVRDFITRQPHVLI